MTVPQVGSRYCRPHIESAGFPNRTALILHREQNLYPLMVQKLTTGGRGAQPDPTIGISMEVLESGFAERDGTKLPATSFLAGRSEPETSKDGAHLTELLDDVISSLDPAGLHSWGPSYVEAAMSSALRGQAEKGHDALAAVITGQEPGATADWLAAYYLAQLGDSSGYPRLIQRLEDPDGFTRLMAARHLAGFLPFDGADAHGSTVDVRARLLDCANDPDELVAREIPALLVEADVRDLSGALTTVAERAHHKEVKQAAKDELARL